MTLRILQQSAHHLLATPFRPRTGLLIALVKASVEIKFVNIVLE